MSVAERKVIEFQAFFVPFFNTCVIGVNCERNSARDDEVRGLQKRGNTVSSISRSDFLFCVCPFCFADVIGDQGSWRKSRETEKNSVSFY